MIKVLCSGCFDIFHPGHLAYLKEAKAHGDYLIVAVTADKFINKGPGRPYFNENVRAEMIRSISFVDEVEIIHDATALPAIHKHKPQVYFKGQDYKDKSQDITGGIIDEEIAVKEYGGELRFAISALESSSHILNRFFIERTEASRQIINQVNELGGLPLIKQIMHDISLLNVHVIGEPIIDTYRFVEPQNISSKYPCISAKFIEEENYNGGSTAILNHIKSFCKVSQPKYYGKVPRKIRYISKDKSQRIFEVTEIDENIACEINLKECDVTILADFGHGLFNESILTICEYIKNFAALNVQTNSSNYGFNTYQKHQRWDYLVLDKREAQLAFHDNKTDPSTLGFRIHEKHDFKPVGITLGSGGADHIFELHTNHSPAFADQVIDATGAGDAYFAITALLVKVNAPPAIVPFIGNVFAGLKTKIVGNKSAVSKAQLMKALEALLK